MGQDSHYGRERFVFFINLFLDKMAKEGKNIITTVCEEQCLHSDNHSAPIITQMINNKKKNKMPNKKKNKMTKKVEFEMLGMAWRAKLSQDSPGPDDN